MLVIEVDPTTSKRRVVFHRDWHNGRLSAAYIPPRENYVFGEDMFRLQRALLMKKRKKNEVNDDANCPKDQ